jgi:hypothetical protein
MDDHQRRFSMAAARKFIYDKNLQVDCVVVENLLKDTSLIPSKVSLSSLAC